MAIARLSVKVGKAGKAAPHAEYIDRDEEKKKKEEQAKTDLEKVTPILEDYGLTMPQAFKLFLNQIVKTKTIPLSFDYARETALTPKAAAKLLQSLKEIENGEYTEYETVEEAIQAMSEEANG